jgi:tetratricopeptide (TPR) repeat protein
MIALAAGRIDEAEDCVARSFAFGERAQPAVAIPVYRLQRYALLDLQGRLGEAEPEIRALVAEYPTRPVFRCALGRLQARLGQLSEAQQALDELARDDFAALPFDQEWLYGMSMLAETAALLGDTDAASVLRALLVPWAALTAGDHPEGIRGSVSRYVGLVATTTGHRDEAARHFEAALQANERMGARPWLAHTQHDYAQMLLARDGHEERARELLERALTTYRELGMESYAASTAVLLDPGGEA